MPAKAKKQQRFFGMVHAVQTGEMDAPSKEVAETASEISRSDAEDFASTKHKGLPDKKEALVRAAGEFIKASFSPTIPKAPAPKLGPSPVPTPGQPGAGVPTPKPPVQPKPPPTPQPFGPTTPNVAMPSRGPLTTQPDTQNLNAVRWNNQPGPNARIFVAGDQQGQPLSQIRQNDPGFYNKLIGQFPHFDSQAMRAPMPGDMRQEPPPRAAPQAPQPLWQQKYDEYMAEPPAPPTIPGVAPPPDPRPPQVTPQSAAAARDAVGNVASRAMSVRPQMPSMPDLSELKSRAGSFVNNMFAQAPTGATPGFGGGFGGGAVSDASGGGMRARPVSSTTTSTSTPVPAPPQPPPAPAPPPEPPAPAPGAQTTGRQPITDLGPGALELTTYSKPEGVDEVRRQEAIESLNRKRTAQGRTPYTPPTEADWAMREREEQAQRRAETPYGFTDSKGVERTFRSPDAMAAYKQRVAGRKKQEQQRLALHRRRRMGRRSRSKYGGTEMSTGITKEAAVQKMAVYLDWLTKRHPDNEPLAKLASEFKEGKNLVEALRATYPAHAKEQVSKLANELIRSLHRKLQKAAMGNPSQGSSIHPSASIASTGGGTGARMAPSMSSSTSIGMPKAAEDEKAGTWVTRNGKRVHVSCRGKRRKKAGHVALQRTLGLEAPSRPFDKEAAGTKALATGKVDKLGPYSTQQAGRAAGLDKLIAAIERNRHEHPWHYWLNPFTGGPFSELISRGQRRHAASRAHGAAPLVGGVAGNVRSSTPYGNLRLGSLGNIIHGGPLQKHRARQGHAITSSKYHEGEEDEAVAKVQRERREKGKEDQDKSAAHGGPFNTVLAGGVTNLDEQIAGLERTRRERPLHYWLNPAVGGPLTELAARYSRRGQAGAYENLPMLLAGLPTLGIAPAIAGGAEAKTRAREGHQEFSSEYEEGEEDAARVKVREQRQEDDKEASLKKCAFGEGLQQWWGGLPPAAQMALIGGGGGAALGGLAGGLSDPEETGRSRGAGALRGAAVGGLAGGGLGAGLGYGVPILAKKLQESYPETGGGGGIGDTATAAMRGDQLPPPRAGYQRITDPGGATIEFPASWTEEEMRRRMEALESVGEGTFYPRNP